MSALLRACLALEHFEAAGQLGRALSHPSRRRSPAMEAELRQIDGVMRGRFEVLNNFRGARFEHLNAVLPTMLQLMPRWAAGWAFLSGTRYHLSPALGDAWTELVARRSSIKVWAHALDIARQEDLRVAAELAERAVSLDGRDRMARLWRVRAHFGMGIEPMRDDLLAIQQKEAGGFDLSTPMPLRPGTDWTGVIATASPELIHVPMPRAFGPTVDWSRAVGTTESAAGYALRLQGAQVRGGSDLVVGACGAVLHDHLSNQLGVVANIVHDKGIVLRHRNWVVSQTPREVVEIPCEAVTLVGQSSRQFGHWLFEHLPRLRHLEGSLDLQKATYLVDAGMPASHIEALELLLGERPRTIEVAQDCVVRARSLWVAGRDVFFPYYLHPSISEGVHIAPALVSGTAWLRKRWCQFGDAGLPTRRLFVRRPPGLRSLVNQDEIERHLVQSWGFESVQPETLPFKEQARLFSQAAWVVGPHGSALSNAVVCSPGTRMLTLFNGVPGNLPAWAAALQTMGIQHTFVAGQPVSNSHAVRHHWDFRIDLPTLDEAMSAMASLKA